VAFLLVGLPGIVIALALKLLMREPPRGHSDPRAQAEPVAPVAPAAVAARPQPRAAFKGQVAEAWSVVRIRSGTRAIAHMVIGVTLASFAGYGVGQFAPPYFIRTFGLNYAEVGAIVGLVAGFSAGIGTLAGSFVADRLARRSERWYALTPAVGLALCTPLYLWAYHQPSWQLTVALLIAPGILHYVYLGPTFGVVQNMVDTRRRATATAILLFFLNLIALGGGPPATGWLIDRMAGFDFANPGVTSTWAAFLGVFQG